ncbi:hypothetical protein [Chryseobacterium sp. SIMBA_029]|uniref:hypothetical protein n=1 Tax=Chryseobacterium sp. SIMBA_029 TaxID=3085772 RepID=UPI00397E889B
MKNSIFIILGILMISCKNQETKNDTQADLTVTSSYDSVRVAPTPPANQNDSTTYRKGADTLKQPIKQNDSIIH